MRPAPVVVALVTHSLITLLWVIATVMYVTRMSPPGLVLGAILLGLQLIGFVGIIRRSPYARTYNAVYFLIWGSFSSLGACAAAGREHDASYSAWGLFVFIFFGWLALSFAIAPKVKAFFARPMSPQDAPATPDPAATDSVTGP